MAASYEGKADSLYNLAVITAVTSYSKLKDGLKDFPENIQFDVYYKLYDKGRLCNLAQEFSEIQTFARVLRVSDKRELLHTCFQAIMHHGQNISATLADAYCQMCCINDLTDSGTKEKTIQLGFNLGGFLSDAGWYYDAEKVYLACYQLCKQNLHKSRNLECCVKIMHVRIANCKFNEAEESWKDAQSFVGQLPNHSKAMFYAEYCALLFSRSLYDEAFKYCNLALKEITSTTSPRVLVDVLCQGSKACVVKRQFGKAELLIKYAVQYAKEHFGSKHHKYSDALLDYGFYLLNVDFISQAVEVYQAALDIRVAVFGHSNLHVAVAHEDLAYSTYVHEYSSGKFTSAREHAESAIKIITAILPKDHLSLASCKRVKALILEEVAIDSHNKETEDRLLHQSHDLHQESLTLAMKAFGENNVQTAKHYGNLGRLYQSMHRYQEAEEMHLKAIRIKERLLGNDDYEVALSVGHLASLYNYDMKKFPEAEQLYLRSIAIGKKLFGDGYSGLEYDYRGLLRLYHSISDSEKADQFARVLQKWNQIRDGNIAKEKKPLDIDTFENVHQVLEKYFHID